MTTDARNIRKIIIDVIYNAKSSHVGSALSCVDILSALYGKIIRLNDYENRDIFILSKAHAAVALYSTLFYYNLLSKDELNGFYKNYGILPAHTDRFTNKYIEVSAGSLGHGMPMAVGMAYSFNLKNNNRYVFSLIGDGEMQEGAIWEAALLASKLQLNNLVVLLDNNKLQAYGIPSEIVYGDNIKKQWESFGWFCVEIDGHNEEELLQAIELHKKTNTTKPLFVICNTIKGKGVSFMENKLCWHYFSINDSDYNNAMGELNEK